MPGRDVYLDGLLGDFARPAASGRAAPDIQVARPSSSGSLAMLAAMRRASSRVSSLAVVRLLGSSARPLRKPLRQV